MSMGFSRQEYWSGLPYPSPGDLPDPGIKSASLTSPALAVRFCVCVCVCCFFFFLPLAPPGKLLTFHEGNVKLPLGSFQINRVQAEKLLKKNPRTILHHTLKSLNIASSLCKHTLVIGLHPHLLKKFKNRAKGSHLSHGVPGHCSMTGFICKPSENPERKRAFYKS